jgi:hypothetical protein
MVHALAGVEERVHHVASDVTGTAGDQDRHIFLAVNARAFFSRCAMNMQLASRCSGGGA